MQPQYFKQNDMNYERYPYSPSNDDIGNSFEASRKLSSNLKLLLKESLILRF